MCYRVTKNIYGNSKSLTLSLINLAYRYKPIETTRLQQILKLERDKAFTTLTGISPPIVRIGLCLDAHVCVLSNIATTAVVRRNTSIR